MRHAGHARYGNRLNGPIVVLWRAGLRINEALSLTETYVERTPQIDPGQARKERSPSSGRHGRVGVVSARTVAVERGRSRLVRCSA